MRRNGKRTRTQRYNDQRVEERDERKESGESKGEEDGSACDGEGVDGEEIDGVTEGAEEVEDGIADEIDDDTEVGHSETSRSVMLSESVDDTVCLGGYVNEMICRPRYRRVSR